MVDITSEADAHASSESTRYKAEGLTIENQIKRRRRTSANTCNDPSHVGRTDSGDGGRGEPTTAIAAQISELQRGHPAPREAAGEQLGAQPRHSGPRQPAGRRAPLDHRLAQLATSRRSRSSATPCARRRRRPTVRISTMPSQEKVILGITRQQKIKEELFLYLLNKQEENAAQLRRSREQLTVDRLRRTAATLPYRPDR